MRDKRAELSDELVEFEGEDAKGLVSKIDDVDAQIIGKVSFISKYVETGKVPEIHKPEEEEEEEDTGGEDSDAILEKLRKNLKTLQSKKSRLNKALQKAPDNQKKMDDLAKVEAEITLLQDQKKLLEHPE